MTRSSVVRLLLERGADPAEPDAEPWAAPRAWAAKMGRCDVLARLRQPQSTPASGLHPMRSRKQVKTALRAPGNRHPFLAGGYTGNSHAPDANFRAAMDGLNVLFNAVFRGPAQRAPADGGGVNLDYDAILIVSFGGPEGPDEVIPFLENVLRGRNVPRERMLEVAEHYGHFGGRSPINEKSRELVAALQERLDRAGLKLPVYWGNRNWRPFLTDTVRQMAADGVRRARAFATSAYASYSGCRQYRENIEAARAAAGLIAPEIDKAGPFHDHPLFIRATAARIAAAKAKLPGGRLVATAHSLPLAMANGSRYEQQVRETARLAADWLGIEEWDVVWQSRSGPPTQPWLAPDIRDHLRSLAREGVREVVIAPIGFLSDHIEVLYDLDVEAAAVANELGIRMVRAETVSTHPDMVELVYQLVTTGTPAPCPDDCCPGPSRPASR